MFSWQQILAQGFSNSNDLLDFLQLSNQKLPVLENPTFKVRVPYGFALRMQKGNPQDPLLLQVLAVQSELQLHSEFDTDPLLEVQANVIPGLIHKYASRVLLTVTGACAVHCRYCFRQHFPYQENNPGRHGWDRVIKYISADPKIREVILSGGDPLLATDSVLAPLVKSLQTIEHVSTLRIHSRIPVVLPERITESLLEILQNQRLKVVVVLHSNHAQELDRSVEEVCQRLRQANCYLLNQSVLLSGVNDDPEVLAALSHRLFACGVLPYYLHLLDKVQGAAHFEVELTKAKGIFQTLQTLLPGYLVPKLAQEEPGKRHKTLIL